MRIKKETVSIRIDKELKDEIVIDRDALQKLHSNGKWSLSDTISKYRDTIAKTKLKNNEVENDKN